ncbi:SAM-dependent methyltransferase [Microtetraspora sp. NBRC 16547]|uniref:SAM-dependent methyltransferase n=1 Tax=Microtetraspora sp. NBRC 16547 TaxID=3030993 RepID=UPI0024A18593|nr:SAM-dependent methyltransferase [Microtetraspora sp. NBRC 16547]GLW98090.1 hypothetical protein Misp02_21770 [Microtetraspora sp. NBRC 16547]
MAPEERPAPTGVDTTIPNGARIYDYMLGGKDNYAVDREAAERMLAANPLAPLTARANRDFLGRAVRFLAEERGIRQFLDIGTGLPTRQNVHEVAHECAPGSRVVYVDYDPLVVAHGQALLGGAPEVAVIQGDLRDPEAILADAAKLIDFDEPVAVLLVAVLHFISDDEGPGAIVERLRDAMVPGGHLVVSHTALESTTEVMATAQQGFRMAGAPLTPRTRAAIGGFFSGLELVEPGLANVREWRAAEPSAGTAASTPWTIVGGVGRKP